jgi:hypothetical protein
MFITNLLEKSIKEKCSVSQRRHPLELALARRLEVVEVAVEFVHARLAELADLRVKEDAVCVGAERKELADRCVRCDADGFVVLYGNN